MRVNVDDVAFMDRRFKLLGGRLGITWQEALGRCLPVWGLAYQRRSAVMPAGDVDALAERPGFAAVMLEVGLAVAEGDEVYLCGVTERIDFLLIQDAKRARAREAKLAAAGVRVPQRHPRGQSRGTLDVSRKDPPEESPGTVPEEGPYSPDLTLPPDHALALDVPPDEPAQPTTGLLVVQEPAKRSPAKPRKQPSRAMPEGWTPRPQERSQAAAAGLSCDDQASHFRDHHAAKGSIFADWDAAFRTWLRNAPRFANGSRAGPMNREPEQPRKIPTLA